MPRFRVLPRHFLLHGTAFLRGLCSALLLLLSCGTSAAPGQLDPTFGEGGISVIRLTNEQDYAAGSLLLPDGRLVVAGTCGPYYRQALCLTRLNSDGLIDRTFGIAGIVTTEIGTTFATVGAPMLDAIDGRRILVAGVCRNVSNSLDTYPDFCVVRYLSDGGLDTSYGDNGVRALRIPGGYATTVAAAMQPDGKVLLLGSCTFDSPAPDFCLTRLNTNGTLDINYGIGGYVRFDAGPGYDYPAALLIDSNNRAIVAGGCVKDVNDLGIGVLRICVTRIAANGTQDVSYGSSGIVVLRAGSYPTVMSLIGAAFGRTLVISACSVVGRVRFCLDMLNQDGLVDATYGIAGHGTLPPQPDGLSYFDEFPSDAARSNDAKLLIVGNCYRNYIPNNVCVKRLMNDATLDASFGDGGSAVHPLGIGTVSVRPLSNGKVLVSGFCAASGLDNMSAHCPR